MRVGPDHIEEPSEGQESVWDYPRPPRVEPSKRFVTVRSSGIDIARSDRALRVLETAGPPTYYIPPDDVRTELLRPVDHTTLCEWKGVARYYDLVVGAEVSERAAWSYPAPSEGYELIAGLISFFPARVDVALLDDEQVRPQPGGYYGGWITDDIVGPFKGDPGTERW